MKKPTQSIVEEIILQGKLSKERLTEHNIGPESFVSMNDRPAGTIITESELKEMIQTPNIVMQSAVFAGVTDSASENWHTQQFLATTPRNVSEDGVIYTPEAELNMRALAAIYLEHGHNVAILPPKEGLIDAHYSTDSNKNFQAAKESGNNEQGERLFELQKPVALSPNFTHENRQPEADHKRRYLETTLQNPNPKAQRTLIQMENNMEFGDTRISLLPLKDSNKSFVLAGIASNESQEYGDGQQKEFIGRSTEAGHKEFEQHLHEHVDPNIQVETIHLNQPFYHMDTTGVVTQDGHFFTTKEAYTEESWQRLQELFEDKLVEVNFDDIHFHFGGNATSFGDQIYISDEVSMETAELMASHGFDVNMTPIPWTKASGGGHRCMTSVDHIAPDIPIDVSIDNERTGTIRKVDINYDTEAITLHERQEDGSWQQTSDLSHKVMSYKELYQQEMQRHDLLGR